MALRLVHPFFSNWGDWDPGTAAGQTECLRPAAGRIHVIPVCIYNLTTQLHLAQPDRGAG